jgi:mono/diheme cytochrome c family protein
MRKRTVTRVSLCICALLGVAAVGFAWLGRTPAPEPGAHRALVPAQSTDAGTPLQSLGLFDTHCASCHGADELADALRAGTGIGSQPGEMEAFLATHGELEARENSEIADYLRQLARSRQP